MIHSQRRQNSRSTLFAVIGLLIGLALCSITANAQDIQKPDAQYLKNLDRYQAIVARRQKRQAAYQKADEQDEIAQKGLEAWLSARVPAKHGLDPRLRLFMPTPEPPLPDKAQPPDSSTAPKK